MQPGLCPVRDHASAGNPSTKTGLILKYIFERKLNHAGICDRIRRQSKAGIPQCVYRYPKVRPVQDVEEFGPYVQLLTFRQGKTLVDGHIPIDQAVRENGVPAHLPVSGIFRIKKAGEIGIQHHFSLSLLKKHL